MTSVYALNDTMFLFCCMFKVALDVLMWACVFLISWLVYSYDLRHGTFGLLMFLVSIISVKEWIIYKKGQQVSKMRYLTYVFVLIYILYWGPMIAKSS